MSLEQIIHPQQKPDSKVSCHQLKPRIIIAFRSKIATNCFRKYHHILTTLNYTSHYKRMPKTFTSFHFSVRGEVSQILHLYEIALKIASSSNLSSIHSPSCVNLWFLKRRSLSADEIHQVSPSLSPAMFPTLPSH